jgi:tripartite-type tricarboxylate transporter receptor subunit TctC
VPKGTPRAIIDKLSAAFRQVATDPAMKPRFLTAGAKLLSSTPEEAKAFADKERATWKEIVAIAGAKAQ